MTKRKAADPLPAVRSKLYAPGLAAISRNLRGDFEEAFQSHTPDIAVKTSLTAPIDGESSATREQI